jgi:hypothetical protein
MGEVMKQHFTSRRAMRLAVVFLGGSVAIGAVFANPVRAADIEEDPAAAVRLSQKASRSCTESCTAECRADRSGCTEQKTDDQASCRARFQICVRRCVVACSPK